MTPLVLTSRGQNRASGISINLIADLQRLQVLSLGHFHFPWHSQPLCALTNLKVENRIDPLPIASFFAGLRSMPSLRVLHLEHWIPEYCDMRDVKHISLRNLRRLHLNSSTCLLKILSVIVAPAETNVSLHFPEPGSRFVSSLSGSFSSVGIGDSRKPSYTYLDSTYEALGYSSLHLAHSEFSSDPSRLTFCSSLLEKSSIPLQDLSSLSLSYPIPAEAFIESFAKCEHLGVINLCRNTVVGLTEAVQAIDKSFLELRSLTLIRSHSRMVFTVSISTSSLD